MLFAKSLQLFHTSVAIPISWICMNGSSVIDAVFPPRQRHFKGWGFCQKRCKQRCAVAMTTLLLWYMHVTSQDRCKRGGACATKACRCFHHAPASQQLQQRFLLADIQISNIRCGCKLLGYPKRNSFTLSIVEKLIVFKWQDFMVAFQTHWLLLFWGQGQRVRGSILKQEAAALLTLNRSGGKWIILIPNCILRMDKDRNETDKRRQVSHDES